MSNGEIIEDIIYYDLPLLKVINENVWKNYFLDEKYGPILKVLMNPPVTVNEIHRQCVSVLEKGKSITSIYLYLKDLIRAQLVKEVGHRVHVDKTFSKRLYSLSAEFILFNNADETVWESDRGTVLSRIIGLIISRHFNDRMPEIPKLTTLLLEIEKKFTSFRETSFKSILELSNQTYADKNQSIEKNFRKIVTQLNFKDFYTFINNLGIFLGLLRDPFFLNMKETLFSSFTQEKIDQISKESPSKEEKQDLITFKPEIIKPLDARTWRKTFAKDINRRAILRILTPGPTSINEIYARHHKTVLAIIEQYSIEKLLGKPPKPKSKNTIYKYLQELIDMGLVTEAGRRPIPHQSATQKLYSRTAEVFYPIDHRREYWDSENAKKVSHAIGLVMCYILKQKSFDSEELHKIFAKFNTDRNKSMEEALKDATITELKKFFPLRDGQESGTFLYTLGLVEWLIKRENVETFRSEIIGCFH
ncbi:MAG: hypothetical protein ACFFC7_05875 [Candidatus Hermodarchaeota archaeon]